MHFTYLGLPKEAQKLCRTHLTVVPLVNPINTIRSRFTRGHNDWQQQVESWKRVVALQNEAVHWSPIDLIARKTDNDRRIALEMMAAHLRFTPPADILKKWSEDWPEHRNQESRTAGLVPDMTPMQRALDDVPGLRDFLTERGY